jgi:hypothetical protein
MSSYEIRVKPLPPDEGGGFLAWVPDLPGCMSDGRTPIEAIETPPRRLTNGSTKPCGWAVPYQLRPASRWLTETVIFPAAAKKRLAEAGRFC